MYSCCDTHLYTTTTGGGGPGLVTCASAACIPRRKIQTGLPAGLTTGQACKTRRNEQPPLAEQISHTSAKHWTTTATTRIPRLAPAKPRSGPKRRDFHRHNSVINNSWFPHDQGHVRPDLPESAEAVSPPLQPANPQLPQVVRSQTEKDSWNASVRRCRQSNLGVGKSLSSISHLPRQRCSSCQHRAVPSSPSGHYTPSHSPLRHVTCQIPITCPTPSPYMYLSTRPQQPRYSISSNRNVPPLSPPAPGDR